MAVAAGLIAWLLGRRGGPSGGPVPPVAAAPLPDVAPDVASDVASDVAPGAAPGVAAGAAEASGTPQPASTSLSWSDLSDADRAAFEQAARDLGL